MSHNLSESFIVKRTIRPPILLLLVIVNGCVEPYTNKSIGTESLLVVEGFISTDNKEHQIAISVTAPIDKPEFIPETGAQVYIKEGSNTIPLTETSPGLYQTPPMQGVVGKTYQLLITTRGGRQLVSEEVTLKDNPAITNLYAIYSPISTTSGTKGEFQILLDTEDSTQQAHFYRWEYEETWEIQTPFESNFEWLGGNDVVFRSAPVSTCYGSDSTNTVIIQSTQGLSHDNVVSKLIQSIPSNSAKLQVTYSILVRQFILSADAYQYWQILQRTNQTQGSLFDTQPGTVLGNITSTTDQEPVLGYFDACVIREKRIFVAPLKFRSYGFVPTDFGADCKSLSFTAVPENEIGDFYNDPANSNMEILGSSSGVLFLLPSQCCDCTATATNVKPSFWP